MPSFKNTKFGSYVYCLLWPKKLPATIKSQKYPCFPIKSFSYHSEVYDPSQIHFGEVGRSGFMFSHTYASLFWCHLLKRLSFSVGLLCFVKNQITTDTCICFYAPSATALTAASVALSYRLDTPDDTTPCFALKNVSLYRRGHIS